MERRGQVLPEGGRGVGGGEVGAGHKAIQIELSVLYYCPLYSVDLADDVCVPITHNEENRLPDVQRPRETLAVLLADFPFQDFSFRFRLREQKVR